MIVVTVSALLAIGAALITYFALYYPNVGFIWTIFLGAFVFFILFMFVYLVFVATFGGIYMAMNKPEKEKPNRFGMFILEQTSFILIRLMNGHPHFSGWGKLPPRKTRFCLVSNHLSGFDHLGLVSILAGRRMICVSKKQNEDILIAGG